MVQWNPDVRTNRECTHIIKTIAWTNPCSFLADPCFYNGSCSNTAGSYKCNCISSKTGKKCELQKSACNNNTCKNSEICALSERSPDGFQCVDKRLEISMVLGGDRPSSAFDLETEIENLIKSAPNNANSVRKTFTEVAVKLREIALKLTWNHSKVQ